MFKKSCFGPVLSFILFSFFFLWALKRMRSCTNVDAFAKVRHTSIGFPKRCDWILICDKDIFKTHLKEVYIMMILCDTEIRTYVLRKKGQTAAARKKVGLPRFSCLTSKFEGLEVWDFLSLGVNRSPVGHQVTKQTNMWCLVGWSGVVKVLCI